MAKTTPPLPSLKSTIPAFAKALDMTPAALYERQRALVRAGLLHARSGRGPGSGVPADAKSLAMMLISVLATGSLSEVEEKTRRFANLKSHGAACPVTGKKSFGAALTAALGSKDLLSRTLSAELVSKGTAGMATISFTKVPISELGLDLPADASWATFSRFGLDLTAFHLEHEGYLTVTGQLLVMGTLRDAGWEPPK